MIIPESTVGRVGKRSGVEDRTQRFKGWRKTVGERLIGAEEQRVMVQLMALDHRLTV